MTRAMICHEPEHHYGNWEPITAFPVKQSNRTSVPLLKIAKYRENKKEYQIVHYTQILCNKMMRDKINNWVAGLGYIMWTPQESVLQFPPLCHSYTYDVPLGFWCIKRPVSILRDNFPIGVFAK